MVSSMKNSTAHMAYPGCLGGAETHMQPYVRCMVACKACIFVRCMVCWRNLHDRNTSGHHPPSHFSPAATADADAFD